MTQTTISRIWTVTIILVFGLTLGAVFALGFVNGFHSQAASIDVQTLDPNLQQLLLRADSANSGKAVSMASVRIDDEFEGLFLLDHLTGNLYCVLINPRTRTEVAVFQNNVMGLLGQDRVGELDFAMITGAMNLNLGGRIDNMRTAPAMVFVAEGNSGKAFGFTFNFDRQRVLNNVRQDGLLDLVWQGSFRAAGTIRN